MCVEFLYTLHDCRNSTKVSSQLQPMLSVGELLGKGNKQSSGRVKKRIVTSDWKEGQGPWVKEGWGEGSGPKVWKLQNETGAVKTWVEQGRVRLGNMGEGGARETMLERQACGQGYKRGGCNIETTTKWNRRLTSEKVLSSSGTGLCIVMMIMLVRLKLA